MKKLLFIVGPTASGKSDLAVKAARLLNSEIISADSMQIYKKMNIGTAKITPSEMQGVKHHMLDIIEPDSEFSVAEYKQQVAPIIENLFNENKIPIICGGTGLYINSILYPLNFSDTARNSELRKRLMLQYDELGADVMHDKLKKVDAISAEKIRKNDKKRLIRALEINILSGGRKKHNEIKKPMYDYLMIGLNTERKLLYERINQRVDEMFIEGLIDEVKNLLKTENITFKSQSMQAIGYKEFKQYLAGEINENELKELIKKHTRNYAKRQITWFKKYPNIVWFDNQDKDAALQLIENTFLR